MDDKLCPGCDTVRPITDFNWRCLKRGKRQTRCRDCTREQVRRHYQNNRAYYIEKALIRNQEVIEEQRRLLLAYLENHPCVDCGEADVVCLEFDHVRGEKRSNVAHMLGDHP